MDPGNIIMKISLIAVNARYTHTNPAVRYLKNYCRDLNCDIDILEYSINSDTKQVINDILTGGYSAAAFSVYIWNRLYVKRIITELNEKGFSGKIVLGGPEASYNSEIFFEELPFIDYIIKGFAEEGFRELVEREFEYPSREIDIRNPPFDDLPFLYEGDNLTEYRNRYLYYETSRGCPYRCSYCLSSADGHLPDIRSTDSVKREISLLMSRAPLLIKFIDRTFNYDRDRCLSIWRHIIENSPPGISWHFEINPVLLDDEAFTLLSGAPAGTFRLEAGIQSLNRDSLKAVRRPGDPDLALRNIKRLAEMKNIHVHADLIAGLPYENIDSFRRGFNQLYGAGPDHLQAGFLKILPGTDLKNETDKYKIRYRQSPPYEVISTGWMSRDELKLIKGVAGMVERYYNSGKYILTLRNINSFFPDTFAMFADIVNYASEKKRETAGTDHVYLIAEYIRDTLPEHREFLFDCLRWDRAFSGARGGEPDFIRNKNLYDNKRSIWKSMTIKKTGTAEKEKIKKGIFFFPESGLFKEKYMNGCEAAVFTGREKPPLFLSSE